VLGLLERAIADLNASRVREGGKLDSVLRERLDRWRSWCARRPR
jgi:uncharacterized protein YicC (UPF0701 family)